MSYLHAWEPGKGFKCPVTGKLAQDTFTDHDRGRSGPYGNACCLCHDDTRTVAQRLRDLNDARQHNRKGALWK